MSNKPASNNMTCLPNLRNVRRDRNLTQKELDNIAHIPDGTVAQIEQGKREPGINTVFKLALALNVKIEELL